MNSEVKNSLLCLLLLIFPFTVFAQDDEVVMAKDAIHHDGEFVMVCGIIAETNYARGSRGSPTYLNFTKPYPRHNFTVIVWKDDRKNFDYKPESLEGQQACVYGQVKVRKNRAQMIISIQDQISARKLETEPVAKSVPEQAQNNK